MNSVLIASRKLIAPALGILALCLPARAGVLVVDAAGGGEYTSLIEAVAAAQAGDTLLVRPGNYKEFLTAIPVIDRSLSIVADGSGHVLVSQIRVQAITPGVRVLLRGLTVSDGSSTNALRVQGADVFAEDCSFKGADGFYAFGGFPGSAGVSVDSGHLVLARCTSLGGQGVSAAGFAFNVSAGGPGLLALAPARVSIYGSTLTGGGGGSYFQNGPGHGAPGGPGVYGSGAILLLAGSTITGGNGGSAKLVVPGLEEAGGDAVKLAGADQLQLLDSTLVPGLGGPSSIGGTGPTGAALVAPSATVTQHPGAYRSYALSSPTLEGEPVQLDFNGEPGDLLAIFWGASLGTLPMPGKQGVFHVAAPLFGPALLGPVGGPDGDLSLSLPIQSLGLGPDIAVVIYEQAFVKPSSGPLLLASPTTHIIVDDSL